MFSLLNRRKNIQPRGFNYKPKKKHTATRLQLQTTFLWRGQRGIPRARP